MKKRFLPFLFLAVSILTWAACNKSVDNDRIYEEPTRGFYPLQLGRSIIYDVDSTIWTDFDCKKRTKHLNLRYTIADTFTDLQGRPSYRVDVDERASDSVAWAVNQVFYITPTAKGLETFMQNLRMQKLTFPVSEGGTWFGNRAIDTSDAALRQFGGWVYRYSNYLQPYNNGRIDFDNTVTVTAVNDLVNNPEMLPNAYAERNFYREVYGYDVGLIYREITYWTYDPSNPTTACRRGYNVVMRATQYK